MAKSQDTFLYNDIKIVYNVYKKNQYLYQIFGSFTSINAAKAFLCVRLLLGILHLTNAYSSKFLPIIQILGFYKSTHSRKTMKILHAYVLHHNSRNLFHINAMKQYHFLFNLRKLIFCLTVMLIYVIAHIQLHFLLLFSMKEKVMKIIQCQMDCPIIKGTKNVSFEAHQILLQCFYGIFGLTKSYVNALNANQ